MSLDVFARSQKEAIVFGTLELQAFVKKLIFAIGVNSMDCIINLIWSCS